jgi:hypothetical protein
MNLYQKNNEHDTLKSIVLGQFYTADYFQEIDAAEIRNPLQQIANEIREDLDHFEYFLKSNGITVIRPDLPSYEEFWQYHADTGRFLRPPLQPRNCHTVIGNTAYQLQSEDRMINQCLQKYNPNINDLTSVNNNYFAQALAKNIDCFRPDQNTWYRRQKYQELAGPDWPKFQDYVQGARSSIPEIQQELMGFGNSLHYNPSDFGPLEGPNLFVTDLGLVVDSNEYCDYSCWIKQHVDYSGSIIKINTGAGHTDGCFAVLGHQLILGIDPLIDYQAAFPVHTVIAVPPENYMNLISGYQIMQQAVQGKWWVPGQEKNQNFTNYVEKYLADWTGHVYESVFDVNVLSINPDTVCVTSNNSEILKQLRKHGVNPVVIPWRHRFFVDGGLHCITLDLCRK